MKYLIIYKNVKNMKSIDDLKKKFNFEKPPRISFKRSVIIFISNILGIYLVSFIGLGVELSYFDDILLFVIFISIINALLWPILTKILQHCNIIPQSKKWYPLTRIPLLNQTNSFNLLFSSAIGRPTILK